MVAEKELFEFAMIIDECRNLVEKVIVKDEISLNYIFSILYSKTLLTMCEIYTLLNAGFPEGAMAMARNTYETLIIMSYLYDKKEDWELIERFYDDYKVKVCNGYIKFLEWIIANGKDDEDTRKRLQEQEDEYKRLFEKHADFISGKNDSNYFKQYWWAGKGKSFNQLRIRTNYPHNYLYDISCYRVHAGMAGMLTLDNTEGGLLIGACEGGKEMPFHFSLLNFVVITKLHFNIQCIECSVILSRMDNLLDNK